MTAPIAAHGKPAQGPTTQDTFVFPAEPNPLAYITLNADNTVTVVSKHLEMGQGVHTGLLTLVADELDAAVAQMRVNPTPPSQDPVYGNPLMGGIQGTGGQTGMQASYMMMRMAGAAMRQMVLAAASRRLGVAATTLTISQGVVRDPASGKQLTFGELAAEAMAMPPPKDVTPKDPAQFTYIGKHFPRVDAEQKVHGKTVFTQDLKLPGMLVAVIARPMRAGGKVARFDATEALAFPGVKQVLEVPAGVAVVATNFWSAYEGREKLKVEWDNTQAERFSTADIFSKLTGLLDQPGALASRGGDVDAALTGAAQRLAADYEVAYTTHATMETLNGVMQITPDGIELWGGCQILAIDSGTLAHVAGIPVEKIRHHMLPVGGSFGRRAGTHALLWVELYGLVKAMGTDQPVKLMYSREDDMSSRGAYHRPGFMHRIEAGLDAGGKLVAWKHRAAGQSILIGTGFEAAMVHDGIDTMSVEGSIDQPYTIPHHLLDLHSPVLPINVSWLRTTGTFHNGFANESMVDELASAAGIEPVAFRLAMLPADSRERGCLELVTAKAGWSAPLKPGAPGTRRGRGVAVVPSHRSFGAAVVEVTVAADQSYTVDRIVCALDCGLVINPDNVIAQMEGSAGFGLGMSRYSEITFKDGEVEQKFYSDHHVTRMHTMPPIECHIVASAQGPSGAAETTAASIAPALANALANATGVRLRKVPLRLLSEPAEEHWDVPAQLNTFKGAPVTTNR